MTFDMSDEDTKNRELKGIVDACKNFNLNRGVVITYDSEDEIISNGIKILLVPFYKWCNDRPLS